MRATDLDWREMFRDGTGPMSLVRSVADEVLAEGQRRRIVIREGRWQTLKFINPDHSQLRSW